MTAAISVGSTMSALDDVKDPLHPGPGLLVGFGTRLGSGCTSGHGVCGVSRGSSRSLIAVATFMTTGAITAIIAGRLS